MRTTIENEGHPLLENYFQESKECSLYSWHGGEHIELCIGDFVIPLSYKSFDEIYEMMTNLQQRTDF